MLFPKTWSPALFFQYVAGYQKEKNRRFTSREVKDGLEKQIVEWNGWILDLSQQIVNIDAKITAIQASAEGIQMC